MRLAILQDQSPARPTMCQAPVGPSLHSSRMPGNKNKHRLALLFSCIECWKGSCIRISMSDTQKGWPWPRRILYVFPDFGIKVGVFLRIQPRTKVFPTILTHKQEIGIVDGPSGFTPNTVGRGIVSHLLRGNPRRHAPDLRAIPVRFRIKMKCIAPKPVRVKEIEALLCDQHMYIIALQRGDDFFVLSIVIAHQHSRVVL